MEMSLESLDSFFILLDTLRTSVYKYKGEHMEQRNANKNINDMEVA